VSRHNGRANLTEPFQRFRGTLGMGVIVCKPGDPEAKGLVERANGYFETSFMPGRSFESPQDFNAQLAMWLRRANNRMHSTLRCRPNDRIIEDRAANPSNYAIVVVSEGASMIGGGVVEGGAMMPRARPR